MVEGENIRLGFRRDMDIFKGIPFAGMPGRFEKPKPHPGWDGALRKAEMQIGPAVCNFEEQITYLILVDFMSVCRCPQGHGLQGQVPPGEPSYD